MANEESIAGRSVQRLAIVWSRAVLAFACLVVEAALNFRGPVMLPAFVFAAYSLATLVGSWETRPGVEFLSIVLETVFFLVYSVFGSGPAVVLPAALFLHLMLACLFLLKWWNTWLIWGASTTVIALAGAPRVDILWPLVFWVGLAVTITSIFWDRREKVLEEGRRQAAEFREQAARIREAERTKLAGDFHDGPLQAFAAVQIRLEVVKRMLEREPEAARQELAALVDLVRRQYMEMRAFLRNLRPVELGGAGLVASIRQVIAEFEKQTGIKVTFETSGEPGLESAERTAEAVQIVREALNNVQKHSRATRVAVSVEGRRNQAVLIIEDNGVGFPFSGSYSLDELEKLGLGPLSIEKRVRSLGGGLLVESRPQGGARLTVELAG